MKSEKLKMGEKVAYGLGDLGNGLMFQFAQLFLLKFYTDVLQIPAYWGGLIFLIAKFFDAFVDTSVGAFGDSRKHISKRGKFRPYILYGLLFLGIATVACFITPNFSETGRIVYAFVTYNIMGFFYSVVNIPYGSLAAAMTMDSGDRTSLAAARNLTGQMAALLTGAVVIPMVAIFATPKIGYISTVALFAAAGVISQILCYTGTHERIIDHTPRKKGDGVKSIKGLLTNRPFIILSIFTILSVGSMFLKMGIQLYYFQYVLGQVGLVSLVSLLSALSIIPAVIFATPLVKKIGKKNVAIYATIGFIIAELVNFFVTGRQVVPYLVVNTISYMFLGFSGTVAFAFVNDVIEYGQLQTGIRSEGIIYSGYSFVRKIAQGVAGFIPGLALTMTGYVANQQQSASTISGISAVYFLIPAIASAISCLVFYFGYDLTDEKHDAIVKELEEQKAVQKMDEESDNSEGNVILGSLEAETTDAGVINHPQG
ncbi:MFS transporter [Lentilactobacillus kefiri]|uniref:MFS transporter n=1 Tax=Lentilactobacillus kefiri TaxID=33962 RepID=UPI0025A131DF|nr:MFS transporter [Lentilactobacillus kefiri]MDM7493387.1 MFS transporter [Lentilactobacillus kefiri]